MAKFFTATLSRMFFMRGEGTAVSVPRTIHRSEDDLVQGNVV